jgi:putative ABC transport system permease protein
MKLVESFIIALRSLQANKLRSALTMLGIIIGVGAVISLMSLGRGAEATVASTFEQLGTNILYVMPRSPEVSGMAGMVTSSAESLTLDDTEAIGRIPGVVFVAPVNENFIEITYGGESINTVMEAATPEYQQAFAYKLLSGQFISERHVASRDLVTVLGYQAAKDLFAARNPVGERVKIKGLRFTVIGVLEEKGGAMMGMSLDNIAVIPITTAQAKLFTSKTAGGEDAVQSISVKVANAGEIDQVTDDIDTVLRRRHRITGDDKPDFAIVSQEQVLNIFSQITGIFTIFLSSIAGISLLVGGIGIMNIMLVSVTERTREIGIRKAVGAKRRDILFQFLIEASMLSLVGGAIGILGGWLLGVAISQVEFSGIKIVSVVSPDIIILAVSVSLFIGLVSGIYPAMRAARLNPIDALHYG